MSSRGLFAEPRTKFISALNGVWASVARRWPARSRWARRPTALSEHVCLFVTLARGGQLQEHALYHAKAWSDEGFSVVVIVISDSYPTVSIEDCGFASGVLLRENRGYDFGAWADALKRVRPLLAKSKTVVLSNDSVFGPFNNFSKVISKIKDHDIDVVGLTESFEFKLHIQSYFIAFKSSVFRSDRFWQFWRNIRMGDRQFVIDHYELPLRRHFETAGFRIASLFPAPAECSENPTLFRWRALIDQGFPYLKVSVLRENPANVDLAGWRTVLRSVGYDPALADRTLCHDAAAYLIERQTAEALD